MRICSKCKSEIPDHELFCPFCGEEVQLVANYETMESRAHIERKKQQERERIERERAELAARELRLKKRQREKRMKTTLIVIILLIGVIIAGFALNMQKHNTSFDYQYRKAMECFQEQDYDDALVYIQKAMKLSPDSADGGVLLGKIQEQLNHDDAAATAYETVIRNHPDCEEAYDQLIPLYVKMKEYDRLQSTLSACTNASIREKFKDYITYEPTFSIEAGDYAETQTLMLTTNGDGDIYYTLDETEPTSASTRYTAAIELSEGKTVVNAVYISKKNISSKVISKTYTISVASPTAPKITPVSGVYTETDDGDDPEITIEVPEGYTAYYSFDQKATATSLRYTGPVSMRSGTHIFYAVLVSSSGKVGDVASATYVYNKTTSTSTQSSSEKNSSASDDDSNKNTSDTQKSYDDEYIQVDSLSGDTSDEGDSNGGNVSSSEEN